MAPQAQRKAPDLGGYVEVKDRVAEFHRRYPEGIVRTRLFEDGMPFKIVRMKGMAVMRDGSFGEFDETFLCVVAEARRKPDEDWFTASSYEPYPGRTPYTRYSELENAETSAWGRAMAALGIGVDKSMASRTEVENRSAEREPAQQQPRNASPAQVASCAQNIMAVKNLGDLLTLMQKVSATMRREVIPGDIVKAPDGSLMTIGQLATAMKNDFENEPRPATADVPTGDLL